MSKQGMIFGILKFYDSKICPLNTLYRMIFILRCFVSKIASLASVKPVQTIICYHSKGKQPVEGDLYVNATCLHTINIQIHAFSCCSDSQQKAHQSIILILSQCKEFCNCDNTSYIYCSIIENSIIVASSLCLIQNTI